jgi:hypothetical protein
MNREERRKTEKKIKSKFRISSMAAKEIVKLQNIRQMYDPIPEGTKVMINVDQTEKGNPARNKWVDKNKDKVFTVKYNKDYGEKPIMVELEEYPVWLWCINELIVISE